MLPNILVAQLVLCNGCVVSGQSDKLINVFATVSVYGSAAQAVPTIIQNALIEL